MDTNVYNKTSAHASHQTQTGEVFLTLNQRIRIPLACDE